VLLEKALPFDRIVGRIAGVAFVVGGVWLLLQRA
jgi:hypothetical protein